MLFVKRLLTALLLLAAIFTVIYVAALGLGRHHARVEAAASVSANLRAFHHDRAVARQAGEEFERQYRPVIGPLALGVAAAVSIWLTFGGHLSWCRERTAAPLPGNVRYGRGTDPFRDIR